MSIKIAVGLGNSGSKYALTRHNAGMIAVSRLAKRHSAEFKYNKFCASHLASVEIGGKTLILCMMDGFMNESGVNFSNVLKFCKLGIQDAIVLYDDITLDVGKIKLADTGSSGGHNGITNIIEKLGASFIRLKIGVGAKPDKRMDLACHVLGQMSEDELSALFSLDSKIDEAFKLLIKDGVAMAQNVVNRKELKPTKKIMDESGNQDNASNGVNI